MASVSTGLPLSAEHDEFTAPFEARGFDVSAIFYCAESVLVAPYRGQGLGHAFFDARETAMDRLQQDLFKDWPLGSKDCPSGIVGMTVSEDAYGGQSASGPPIVEFTALGTAIAPLAPNDPRRKPTPPKPRLVVPLDR